MTTKTSSNSSLPTLRFFNYRTRQFEIFEPTDLPVGLYTCGPTVYSTAHIGNFRTYLFADILRRTLDYFGLSVRQVMNITDVEDKIIATAQDQGKTIEAITEPNTEIFFADLQKLSIAADVYPRATEHITTMISLIERLIQRGLAYEHEGSVYFSIAAFPAYGQLIDVDLSELRSGERVLRDEYTKEAVQDFALWKAAKAGEREAGATWESPWGPGRPGWHIECSAMSMQELGETFDFHLGGIDLLFPHHEDELAQSEGATGKQFARFFLEGEHLMVDGKKMSKSLGNLYTLRDIEERGIEPLAFRYLCLTAHYRSKLNFTWESLRAAQRTLRRLRQLQYRPALPLDNEVVRQIDQALAQDLDMPRVLALLHHANNPVLWERYEPVLGLGFVRVEEENADAMQLDTLLAERNKARKVGDYSLADTLRDEIRAQGFEIEDTTSGSRLIPKTLDNGDKKSDDEY